MSTFTRREALTVIICVAAVLTVLIPLITYFLLRDALVIQFVVGAQGLNGTSPFIPA